jgi:hypothetical protein
MDRALFFIPILYSRRGHKENFIPYACVFSAGSALLKLKSLLFQDEFCIREQLQQSLLIFGHAALCLCCETLSGCLKRWLQDQSRYFSWSGVRNRKQLKVLKIGSTALLYIAGGFAVLKIFIFACAKLCRLVLETGGCSDPDSGTGERGACGKC